MWMGIKYIVDTDILAKEIKLLGVGKGRAAMALPSIPLLGWVGGRWRVMATLQHSFFS